MIIDLSLLSKVRARDEPILNHISVLSPIEEALATFPCSFEDENSSKKPRLEASAENGWIEEMVSPKHKLWGRIQASELAAVTRKLREFIPPGTCIEIRDRQNEAMENDRSLDAQERRALKRPDIRKVSNQMAVFNIRIW